MSGASETYIGQMSLRHALGQVSTRSLFGGYCPPETVGLFVQYLETESLKLIKPTTTKNRDSVRRYAMTG